VPAQLVSVPYAFADDEIVWRSPISTGAAAAGDIEVALVRAAAEVVGRDLFVSAWLLEAVLPALKLSHWSYRHPLLAQMEVACRRYRLRPEFRLIKTELPLHTVVCALWDDSGVGPPLVVSAKTDTDPAVAMLGSLEEAHQARPWLRDAYAKWAGEPPSREKPISDMPDDLRQRAELWFRRETLDVFKTWWYRSSATIEPEDLPIARTSALQLLEHIAHEGVDIYYVDLTARLPLTIQSKIAVVKVLIPQYQPLYLTESLKDAASIRLATFPRRTGYDTSRASSDIQPIPHPFL